MAKSNRCGRLALVLLPVLLTASCDKAKKLFGSARSAVEKKISSSSEGDVDRAADPALQKLIDQSAEGYLFRKDLPFPANVNVTVKRTLEISGHWMQSSELGKEARVFKGTETFGGRFERSGEQIRLTLSDYSLKAAENPDEETKEEPLKTTPAPEKPTVFKHSTKGWTVDPSSDFHAAMNWKSMAPRFDDLLIEHGLSPRPMWFGKRRLKVGDPLSVSADSLPMLVPGKSTGSLHLTLEAIGAVHGHPCGIFSVTGNYSRKQVPDLNGQLNDEEVTISSGKLWVSLLYPIVLREEADTIESVRSGGQGGLVERSQGAVKVSIIREWKKVE